MKKVLIIIGTILFATVIVVAGKYIGNNIKKPTAIINDKSFTLYVAETPKDKEIGLSKYESLPENYGMLFPFDKAAIYSFWMKDMKFPIDIIFIRNNKIVTIHKNVKPPANADENPPIYNPSDPADTVLEINAGLSEKYGFKNGDYVKLSNIL